jgi:hypothetical protein
MGASYQNYQWVFKHYCEQYRLSVWNTSEIGRTIRTFADSMGDRDSAWVIPHPHWVDTRLVGINAGFPEKDYALRVEDVSETISSPSAQLFVVRPSDEKAIQMLDQLYPGGIWEKYKSRVPNKDFLLFYTSVHDG